jgi:hypothetical protein
MSTFRYGFLLGAAMLLLPTVSEAMPAAALNSGTAVTQVAQGCGSPGAWRGPNGQCHYGGYSGRRCWRGPNGRLHCEY